VLQSYGKIGRSRFMVNSKKNILITGATGLVGARLTEILTARGDKVVHLSRSMHSGPIRTFQWNVASNNIDANAFDGIDAIIHLAGAGVADERWTTKRKIEILESRTRSTQLIINSLKNISHHVQSFVSASAIGYYGFDRNELFDEDATAGNDFLASVTRQWEDAVEKAGTVVPNVVKLRIGVVLSEKGGALKEMATPVKYFVGAPLGSGSQYLSWIHIDDLCGIFIKALDEPLNGVFNAVAPNPVTNRQLTKAIGRVMHKPIVLPAVPEFALRLILGEMAELVITGSRVSCEKILNAGYKFQFRDAGRAIEDLIRKSDSR
jgi:uncharacterized protein (TIGR01777 family)